MFGRNKKEEDILSGIEILVPKIEAIDVFQEGEPIQVSSFSSDTKTNTPVYPLSLEEILGQDAPKDSQIQYKNSTLEEKGSVEEVLGEDISIQTLETKQSSKFLATTWFLIRYTLTSSIIFGVLLLSTNYQAYYSVAYSYFFQGKMIEKQIGLINSVEAGSVGKEEELSAAGEEPLQENPHSVHSLMAKAKNGDVNLDITITPYENRIIIPKIGKNIPLIDVKQEKVSGLKELNTIFMDELEKGIVRYPGSGKPGKVGNAFIFGHSSNFPWIKGEYNDVFALLGNLEIGDEVIVYYEQQKYIYKISEKAVIDPDDVSVLKRKNDISEITLMTCWPIGTDIERLIVIGELIASK